MTDKPPVAESPPDGAPPREAPTKAAGARRAAAGDPSTWPALAFRLAVNPKFWLILVASTIATIVVLRISGYDLLGSLLTRTGLSLAPSHENISGKWKYRCTINGENYQHGGTCSIEQTPTTYGITWHLFGQRKWKSTADASGKWQTVHLEPAFNWETSWGAITEHNKIKFTYTITTPEGNIDGYAWGAINLDEDGKPKSITGNFYQLPPFKACYGICEFRRMSNDGDDGW